MMMCAISKGLDNTGVSVLHALTEKRGSSGRERWVLSCMTCVLCCVVCRTDMHTQCGFTAFIEFSPKTIK